MTHTPHRAQVIADLRAFADFLEGHPDLPVAKHHPVRVAVHPRYDTGATTETETIAEVERIASLLGITVTTTHGHHTARTTFGTVTYEAVAIEEAATAAYRARASYEDVITLDQVEEG